MGAWVRGYLLANLMAFPSSVFTCRLDHLMRMPRSSTQLRL